MTIAAGRLAVIAVLTLLITSARTGGRDERHRQRLDEIDMGDHPRGDHADYVADLAPLGPQTGLVVIIEAAQPRLDIHDSD